MVTDTKKTKLIFDLGGSGVNCIEILTYRRGNFVNAISGYQKSSNRIEVSDVSQFKVGDIGEIQQDNDPQLMYTQSSWNTSWAQYAVGQFFRIVAIEGNTLVIDPPLNITFRADLNPQVRRNNLISNVGFEDFYIERVDNGDGNTFYFKNAANCWIRRVESSNTVKAHCSATSCLNLEIRECYFHHSHRYDGGGHGYGVELGFHVTNCLVENNIFKHLRHSMMVHIGANGNVFGYNYSIEPYQDEAPGVWTPCDISIHGHYPFMNLFEGNIVQEIDCTDYWGPAGPGNTFFRNRVEQEGIQLMDYSHSQNVIGNEIITDTISVSNEIRDTLLHGNNIQGSISWASGLDQNLPASLYKNSKPDFFGDLDWPPIGPDKTLNTGTIPAKLRYETAEYIPTHSNSISLYTITINITPEGAGNVNLNPSTAQYPAGTTVTLEAVANQGYKFSHWGGDIINTQNPLVITMDSNKSITAYFVPISTQSGVVVSTYTLSISVEPQGAGTVSLSPSGGLYVAGTTVTLTATASAGYEFSYWSGDLSGSGNPAVLVMNSNKQVVAHFSVVISTDSKPQITSINLQNNQQISGEYAIDVVCGDDKGISKVEFYIDGNLVHTDTNQPYSYVINTLNLSNGSHTLMVVVYDTSNQATTTEINFDVNNTVEPPQQQPTQQPKDTYILTFNKDDKNEAIDFGSEIVEIKLYDTKGKLVYDKEGNILTYSSPGIYICITKDISGKTNINKLVIRSLTSESKTF